MEGITRNVRDMEAGERRVLEHVIGQPLKENQKVIIQVVTRGSQPAKVPEETPAGKLPEWCNVFAGLTSKEIAAVEAVIRQRSDLTRPSE